MNHYMNYYKILNQNEIRVDGFQFRTGLNIDSKFVEDNNFSNNTGLSFSRRDILYFLHEGIWIRRVTLFSDSIVVVSDRHPTRWKTDKFILGKREYIDVNIFRRLITEGAVLYEPFRNLSILDNAIYSGQLDIVKYLIEDKEWNNLDINWISSMRIAIERGHLDILKYLIKIRKLVDNYTFLLRESIINKQTRISQYLVGIGADIKEAVQEVHEHRRYMEELHGKVSIFI